MVTGSDKTPRLAVLSDADKAQPAAIGAPRSRKLCAAHVKRPYGDLTGTSLKGWKDQLLAQSIQQFAYTRARRPRRAGAHPAGTRRAEHTRAQSLIAGDFGPGRDRLSGQEGLGAPSAHRMARRPC